jgi:hypothetical protein
MAGPVESSGPIETFCHLADAPSSRRSTFSFDAVSAGDRVAVCFAAQDTNPPYALKVRAPNGALIVDRLIRDLPTGLPQSEPPIEFLVSARGKYTIELRELQGAQWGKALLSVV